MKPARLRFVKLELSNSIEFPGPRYQLQLVEDPIDGRPPLQLELEISMRHPAAEKLLKAFDLGKDLKAWFLEGGIRLEVVDPDLTPAPKILGAEDDVAGLELERMVDQIVEPMTEARALDILRRATAVEYFGEDCEAPSIDEALEALHFYAAREASS